jgi:hypothetical protein
MGDDVSAITAEHSAQMAGSAYCSNRQGLVVFVKPGQPAVEQRLAEVAANYPELTFEVRYVPRSLDEMQTLVAKLVATGLPGLGLSGVGPDITTGGLLLEAQRYGEKADSPADQILADAEAAARAIVGDAVPTSVTLATSEFETA